MIKAEAQTPLESENVLVTKIRPGSNDDICLRSFTNPDWSFNIHTDFNDAGTLCRRPVTSDPRLWWKRL